MNLTEAGFYIFATYDEAILGYRCEDEEGRNFSPVWKVEDEECAEAIADALAKRFEEDVAVSVGPANEWPLSARLEFDADLAKRYRNRRPPHVSPEGMDLAGWLPFEMTKHAVALHEAYRAASGADMPRADNAKARRIPPTHAPTKEAAQHRMSPSRAEVRCAPMSKTEIARRYLNRNKAKPEQAKKWMAVQDLQPTPDGLWTIRIDDLPPDVQDRFKKPVC